MTVESPGAYFSIIYLELMTVLTTLGHSFQPLG